MNLRNVFKAISEKFAAEFKISSQFKHPVGKGDNREAALREFLKEYLPKRYSVGRGEIISSGNIVSKQCDIVIYDAEFCPSLIVSEHHALYPLESVYGVIEVKSTLTAQDLDMAYENIRSVKELVRDEHFRLSSTAGVVSVGL